MCSPQPITARMGVRSRPGHIAVSGYVLCSQSVMDVKKQKKAAGLCVCLTESGAEHHTQQRTNSKQDDEACAADSLFCFC